MPFRLPERSALLASCLSAARTQSVGKMAYKKNAVRWQSECGPRNNGCSEARNTHLCKLRTWRLLPSLSDPRCQWVEPVGAPSMHPSSLPAPYSRTGFFYAVSTTRSGPGLHIYAVFLISPSILLWGPSAESLRRSAFQSSRVLIDCQDG